MPTWEIRAADAEEEYDLSKYKLRLPVLTQGGVESTMILSLSSMITNDSDDLKTAKERYV